MAHFHRYRAYPGQHDLEIVGESNYQDSLWRVVGGLTAERVRKDVQAIVATEPDNPYDPNAISVWIDGHKVGYFCREDAQAYQPGLVKLYEKEDTHVALPGVVTGGGPRDGRLGFLGVWLYCNPADFEVAEVPFTAFASRGKSRQVSARLIVRRVRDANPDHVQVNAQGELFRVWRHHAILTDSPLPMLAAEADHRRHAIVEQVIADLKNGPLAHLPSARFAANSAWLVLAAIAFNLTRAIGALASLTHAKATTATIRSQLINIAARVATSARRTTLHLPAAWPWAQSWMRLFTAATGPPAAA